MKKILRQLFKYAWPIAFGLILFVCFYFPQLRFLVIIAPVFLFVFLNKFAKNEWQAGLGVWLGFFVLALLVFLNIKIDAET